MKKKVIIIAEAGVNCNGNIEIARKMVVVAKNAGADIIKFQTMVPELAMIKNTPKAKYQQSTTNNSESQLEMCKKIFLPLSSYRKLKQYCQDQGIEFLSTPFDLKSIDALEEIGVSTFKIPSGEITNFPYLKKIGQLNKKIILSTGMSTIQEIGDALKVLIKSGSKLANISILHCTTEYPAPFSDINLKAMETIRNKFKVKVGYSDHSLGIEVSIAAAALGATIIEKHFTLDKNMTGPDHKASLDPRELKELVKAIRNVELALGDGIKVPRPSEIKNILIVRKSIVANKKIKKGEKFSEDNLTTKRPGTGISAMKWRSTLGQVSKRDFGPDDLIEL